MHPHASPATGSVTNASRLAALTNDFRAPGLARRPKGILTVWTGALIALALSGCQSDPSSPQALTRLSRSESLHGRKAQEAGNSSTEHPASGRPRPARWGTPTPVETLSVVDPSDSSMLPIKTQEGPSRYPVGTELLWTQLPIDSAVEFYTRQNRNAKVRQPNSHTRTVTMPGARGTLVLVISRRNSQKTLIAKHQLQRGQEAPLGSTDEARP